MKPLYALLLVVICSFISCSNDNDAIDSDFTSYYEIAKTELISGKFGAAIEKGNTLIEALAESPNDELIIRAHILLGTAFEHQGKHTAAYKHFKVAADKVHLVESITLGAYAQLGLGSIMAKAGADSVAIEHYKAAYPIFQKIDDNEHYASCLVNLGILTFQQKHSTNSLKYLNQASADIVSPNWSYHVQYQLGRIFHAQEEYETAEVHYQSALELAQAEGNPLLQAITLNKLAMVAFAQGDMATTEQVSRESVSLIQGEAKWSNEFTIHSYDLAKVLNYLNRPSEARKALEPLQEMYGTIGHTEKWQQAIHLLETLCHDLGDHKAGRKYAAQLQEAYKLPKPTPFNPAGLLAELRQIDNEALNMALVGQSHQLEQKNTKASRANLLLFAALALALFMAYRQYATKQRLEVAKDEAKWFNETIRDVSGESNQHMLRVHDAMVRMRKKLDAEQKSRPRNSLSRLWPFRKPH